MTLAQLEQVSEDAAWADLDLRGHLRGINGYAFAELPAGRLRVQHRKGPERKRGQRSYWLNNFPISRAYAQALAG